MKRKTLFWISIVMMAFALLLAGAFLVSIFSANTAAAPTLTRPDGLFPRPAPDMSLPGQVGWLTVPGTDIDGPVMQAEDNDFYLRRNEAGQEDIWGCSFLDYECGPNSQNLIVYGHSLGDNADAAHFSQLKRFLDESFHRKNKAIELYYDGVWREYEVFSAGYADVNQDRVAIVADPQADIAAQLVTAAQKRSEIATSVEASAADALLTLCTCTADAQTRFVVTAVQR